MAETVRQFGIWVDQKLRPDRSTEEIPSVAIREQQHGITGLARARRGQGAAAGVIWVRADGRTERRNAGDALDAAQSEDLGLAGPNLTWRQIAFLLAVILDRPPGRAARWKDLVGRRARIRERLGMTEDGFEKWVKRSLTVEPGRILQWDAQRNFGRGPARSTGTWWVAPKNVHLAPDVGAAEEFIEAQAKASTLRAEDPESLLKAAEAAQGMDNWPDAYDHAIEAAIVYARRDWSRSDPRWFQILFAIGGIEMQLGRPGLEPSVSINVRRSLSSPRQRLTGSRAQILLAKAHHLAALVHNQRNSVAGASLAMQELGLALGAVRGLSLPEAVRQRWDTRVYEELTRARLGGYAVTELNDSAIWQSIEYYRDVGDLPKSEQERMRYGESLLCAGRACDAVEHLERAIGSGSLTTAARVIGERLHATAIWTAGGSADQALGQLHTVEREVRSLGFSHQLRTIRGDTDLIRRGIRVVAILRP